MKINALTRKSTNKSGGSGLAFLELQSLGTEPKQQTAQIPPRRDKGVLALSLFGGLRLSGSKQPKTSKSENLMQKYKKIYRRLKIYYCFSMQHPMVFWYLQKKAGYLFAASLLL